MKNTEKLLLRHKGFKGSLRGKREGGLELALVMYRKALIREKPLKKHAEKAEKHSKNPKIKPLQNQLFNQKRQPKTLIFRRTEKRRKFRRSKNVKKSNYSKLSARKNKAQRDNLLGQPS
ncbi:MAG TPA: hypothetical protein HA227_01385 [Candidatus Diapherotrites archaeon]|uniref:Uncharacterized protein n=1 Tax=Candidatus Iainarchaeum sp. TaxID=3101447 RepID=A0A7J4KSL5_9ARCH|nr:hypothetical protein [Candidatus Diapherotrites archaeon]